MNGIDESPLYNRQTSEVITSNKKGEPFIYENPHFNLDEEYDMLRIENERQEELDAILNNQLLEDDEA